MNKNLRLSLIAVVCSLTITACSSSNKGATRYENLVKNKTEEAIKKAEEKVKRAQDSETAKKLADLEKKKKELEAELAKKQNDNADAVEKKEPVVVNPADTANARVLTAEEAKKELKMAFSDNGTTNDESKIILLSGGKAHITASSFTISDINKTDNQDLNILVVDNTPITLFDSETMKAHREASYTVTNTDDLSGKIFDINDSNGSGKVGSIPKSGTKSDFEHMRYGYFTDKNGKTELFVQGYMTPTSTNPDEKNQSPFNYWNASNGKNSQPQRLYSLPTENVYEYHGKAFYGNGAKYSELNTKAYADFNNNKVKVELSDNASTKLVFGGEISGNKFAGEHNGIITEGAFFGSKANDLGGIFYQTQGDDKGNNGVFGATQKDCGWQGCAKLDINLKDFKISK